VRSFAVAEFFSCVLLFCGRILGLQFPVWFFQVSGYMVGPCSTLLLIGGWGVEASKFSTASANTYSLRAYALNIGCLLLSLPLLVPPLSRTCFFLFFHLPPRWVSSTSTMPESCFGTPVLRAPGYVRVALKTGLLLRPVSSAIRLELCSSTNQPGNSNRCVFVNLGDNFLYGFHSWLQPAQIMGRVFDYVLRPRIMTN